LEYRETWNGKLERREVLPSCLVIYERPLLHVFFSFLFFFSFSFSICVFDYQK
jgi:hypothetical protein